MPVVLRHKICGNVTAALGSNVALYSLNPRLEFLEQARQSGCGVAGGQTGNSVSL